jgi:hypothetical protein
MDQAINRRVRSTLLFLVGALIVAALLRHAVHVYGGFSREDIRVFALLTLPVALVVFSRLRRRR